MLCDHVVDVTSEQRERAAELESTAHRVIRHMRAVFPHDIEWNMLQKWWNGKVFVGPSENVATFESDSGCLVIGIPKDGGRLEQLNTHLLLALSKGASNGRPCTRLHNAILKEASTKLDINFELTCALMFEHGLIDAWGKDAGCQNSRLSWPELIGLPVDHVIKAFETSGYKVETATWDTMYGKPGAPGGIRVIYDARSRRVVSPAPHVGTLPIPQKDDQCFIKADDASQITCIGAPLSYPPADWQSYVGKFFPEVIDSLRMQYPHAAIEPIPSTTGISRDVRRDRIRVWFDPITARVVRSPTIG